MSIQSTPFPVPDAYKVMNPALFFGVVFDLLLFGILTAQAYVYYISFPRDRMLLKIAVVWVYLAGVAQTGVVLLDFYTWDDQWRQAWNQIQVVDEGVYFHGDHFYITITTLTAAVAVVIQSLYAYRIYLFFKSRLLTIIIICMTLAQLASGILGAICSAPLISVAIYLDLQSDIDPGHQQVCHTNYFEFLWGPFNIMCDLTITVSMVTFLIRHRQRTIRNQTRSHITKVIQIVVETGMITTMLMVVYTALIVTGSFESYMLPGLMMSKVYSNSMLVLLNNRATIANGRNAVESFEFVEVSGQGLENDFQLRTRGRSFTDSTPAQS